MATHSSMLAWRISWTEEPGGLQSMRTQRVGHDWSNLVHMHGWDSWMASLTRWTWVWVNSGSWWWTGRPGVLRFMASQRVGHDWATELNWTEADEEETYLLPCLVWGVTWCAGNCSLPHGSYCSYPSPFLSSLCVFLLVWLSSQQHGVIKGAEAASHA